MTYAPDMKESRKIIGQFSFSVARRIPAASHISREDIEQEMWVAWCAARDSFDETMGVPFGAYLRRGLMHHINRHVQRNIWRFKEQTFALSLDMVMGEDGGTLSDVIPSSTDTPEKIVSEESCYQAALRNLSDRARLFVMLLHEQPEEIVAEVMLAGDKAEHAKKIGAPFAQPRRVTSSIIFDLMGAGTTERRKIVKEVEKLGSRISK